MSLRHALAQTGSLCNVMVENVLYPLPTSSCTFFVVKQKEILPEIEIKRRKTSFINSSS